MSRYFISSSVSSRICTSNIGYTTFDAPRGVQDVLRLAFRPISIRADGRRLQERPSLNASGYSVSPLPSGDCLVTIRHDDRTHIVVEGPDPQEVVDDTQFNLTGAWVTVKDQAAQGSSFQSADQTGDTLGRARRQMGADLASDHGVHQRRQSDREPERAARCGEHALPDRSLHQP